MKIKIKHTKHGMQQEDLSGKFIAANIYINKEERSQDQQLNFVL